MSEDEILRLFKEERVSLTELERRSGFSRKKVTRICREVLRQKTGPKKVQSFKAGAGALDIVRARVSNVFDLGALV